MNNNDFLNFFSFFGNKKQPKSQEPNPAEPVETIETSQSTGPESLKSKLHRECFTNYELIVLYTGKVSSVVIHYQKMCQENSKITIIDQIKIDTKSLNVEIFTEFQKKLTNGQIEFTNDKAKGIFQALKSVFGVN